MTKSIAAATVCLIAAVGTAQAAVITYNLPHIGAAVMGNGFRSRQCVDVIPICFRATAMLNHIDLEASGRPIEPVSQGAHRDAAADCRAHA